MQLTEEKVEYKTIKLILNKIEVKTIRTRKQINKEKKIRKNIQSITRKTMANKSIFKNQKKTNSRMCISFLLETQIKQKANQTKQKKLFTSFKNYSRKQYSKNSDIVADTNHTQKKKNLQKYSKRKLQYSELFLSRYL